MLPAMGRERNFLGVKEMFCILILVVVRKVAHLSKLSTPKTGLFFLFVCKLYFSKKNIS